MAKLICFDGCRGSGKSTQVNILSKKLERIGKSFQVIREKNYSAFNKLIAEFYERFGDLRDHRFTLDEARCFAKVRRTIFKEEVLPIARNCDYLIYDRYFYTSAAYQSNEDMSVSEVIDKNIEEGVRVPDISFILTCPPAVSLNRLSRRCNSKIENIDQLRSLFQKYSQISCKEVIKINTESLNPMELSNIIDYEMQ